MDLPTYTNIWRIEKRLYKLYDFRLPMPLPVGTFGVALGVFALWVVLLSVLNAPFVFGNGWHLVLWVVPPGVITVLATRPVIEGKRLTELLISQTRFLTEARVYTRLAPEYEPAEVRVAVRVWHRDPEAGPLPLAGRRRAGSKAVEAESEEVTVRNAAVRPSLAEAPPLRGVARPVTRTTDGERVFGPVGAGRQTTGAEAPARPSAKPPAKTDNGPAWKREAATAPGSAPARAESAPARTERAAVAVAAHPGPEDHGSARPLEEEPHAYGASAASAASSASGASGDPGDGSRPSGGPRRGIGRRMLNYFGFALEPGPPGLPQEPRRTGADDRGDGDGHGDRDTGFSGEPVYGTEDDEQRDSDEWFSRLRASSGQTPVGLTSKSAYSVGDTTAMSRDELADAVADPDRRRRASRERRRAEEVTNAPEPVTEEETSAARRLRGRTQGLRVAKDLEERRSEQVRERGPKEQRTVRAQGRGLPVAGEAAQAPSDPEATDRLRRGRPHAAPWELGETEKAEGTGRTEQAGREQGPGGGADLSDYAARYAAATGRPAAEAGAVPWLPPASATPEEGPRRASSQNLDGAAPERSTAATGTTAGAGAGTAERSTAAASGSVAAATADTADTADTDTGPHRDPEPAPADRKPALELDHGTGEQDAIAWKPREETEDRGPEWNAHMSVLDRHLITADTPAPPRPKFAEAAAGERAGERDGEAKDPAEWFEDGKKRHPDQPKVGDRGNPVIPASELREESVATPAPEDASDAVTATGDAEAAKTPARADEPKPPTQLDHGTGELVSFAEVRDEPRRGDGNVRADAGAATDRRRTVSDLEAAEAAALERRREAARRDTGRRPGTGGAFEEGSGGFGESRNSHPQASGGVRGDGPTRDRWSMRATGTARDPRANPSMAEALTPEQAPAEDLWSQGTRDAERATGAGEGLDTGEGAGTGESADEPGSAHGDRAAQDPQDDGGLHDGGLHDGVFHDGVFHRVAQNARRLGQLFGHPIPGEEPEPSKREPRSELELDHGTGEQERLGDTPNGVPSQRPGPPAPRQQQEAEATSDSGGTRGWRRLAKVVTGGTAPVRSDLPDSDIERLRTPLDGPRGLVVLGCTGGAGQTVTTLMIGHTLAAHRDDLVVAVDVNPGPNGLSRRVGAQTPETLTGLLANAEAIRDYSQMSGYVSRADTGLEVVQTLDDPYVQTLDDRDYSQLASLLGGFYGITLLDPAATGVARALPVADGLVLVAPANADAERAVSMTFDWLDGNGYGALRARSVLVVNGVSKRSLKDVDAAERVARGRCRAIVRIPWDDHLGSSYTKIDVGALRPATKRAHGALGGVLVNSLTL